MQSLRTLHSLCSASAPRLLLMAAAATGLAGGACSSSKSSSAGATPGGAQIALVDSVLETTEGFVVQFTGATQAEAETTAAFPCYVGGTATVTQSATALTVAYQACNMGIETFDGSLSVACASSGTIVTDTFNGTVAIAYAPDAGLASPGDCTFETLSLSTTGNDTGVIRIGGTTYAPTSLAYNGTALAACPAFVGADAGDEAGGDAGVASTADAGDAG